MNNAGEDSIQRQGLAGIFGDGVIEQAMLVDVADLNLDVSMTAAISAGVTGLKQRRGDLAAQRRFIAAMQPGEQLLVCMWVLEMELCDKILAPDSSR